MHNSEPHVQVTCFTHIQDLINNYNCTCAVGYFGRNCETNIDDCLPRPCVNGGTCIDQVNGYRCQCTDDFEVSRLQYVYKNKKF